MGQYTRQHSFTAGEKPTEAQWNVDIDGVITTLNGNLDKANVDYSGSDGICVKDENMTVTGVWTMTGGLNVNSAFVFNEAGADLDARFEGDTDTNLLLIDAGNDAVLIGASAPDGSEKLKVVGDLRVDGDLDFVGPQEISTSSGALTFAPATQSIFNTSVFIGDTACGTVDTGLVINRKTSSSGKDLINGKSNGIAHGLISQNETDTFMRMGMINNTYGGVQLAGFLHDESAERVSMSFSGFGGTALTTKTTAGVGLATVDVYEHDGSNNLANITADGAVFSVRAYVGGGLSTRFLVDEDGDLFAVNATVTALDNYDDVGLIRALELSRAQDGIVKNKWDQFVKHSRSTLIDLGVLGDDRKCDGEAMVNVTQLQRLHNGAIWQMHSRMMDALEKIELAVPQLRGKLLEV